MANGAESPKDYTLLRDYMNEHYAAARHQQALRVQSLTLLSALAGVLFSNGILHYGDELVAWTYGVGLLIIALAAIFLNSHFHRANRYHVEIARRARNAMSDGLKAATHKTDSYLHPYHDEVRLDPNLIGGAVRIGWDESGIHRVMEEDSIYYNALRGKIDGTKTSERQIEKMLNNGMNLVPYILAVGGIVILVLNKDVRSFWMNFGSHFKG